MSDLTIRQDDFSFKIVSAESARFYIRVTTPKFSETSMVFSDFILNPDDNERAIEALHRIKLQNFILAPFMRLVFQDIHPSYRGGEDRAELIRRHDQIVSVVKDYASQTGLTVGNTFLEPKAGKFETMVLIE